MKSLLDNSQHIFGSKTDELGCTGVVKHTIDTEGRGPICLRAYRNSPRQREIAEEIIKELLKNKIIRPSLSCGPHPLCLLRKRPGKHVFVSIKEN